MDVKHDGRTQDEERLSRQDGHRYDAPESDEDRISKEWAYAVLGLLVVVLLVLIATGKVPIFGPDRRVGADGPLDPSSRRRWAAGSARDAVQPVAGVAEARDDVALLVELLVHARR